MKSTGQGETSSVEQGEVDEPTEITDRNDMNKLKNMSEGSKLRVIPVDTPLYKSIKGYWTPIKESEKSDKDLKLKKGDIVTYKGKYELFKNAATDDVIVYLNVILDDKTEGYLKLTTVELDTEETNNAKTKTGKVNQRDMKVTSRAGVSNKTIGKEEENYTVAIAAGRNNDDEKGITNEEKNLVEEELTIKVAEKVEKILGEYTNIKVVQTGSTTSNPGGVKNEKRAEKAKDVNPNLCVQIYFGDGEKAGVETIYRQGDEISKQFAEILVKNLSSTMGLANLNAGADTDKCKDSEGNAASLNIIDNAAVTGFPSVVAMGGNLNKDPDASKIASDGVEKYAEAIVKSIDEYFKTDRSGRTSTEDEKTTYKDSTESKIINMEYVPEEQFKKYISDGNFDKALRTYTIDKDRNLVVATWTQKEDGSIELKTNNSMNLKNALKKYIMPYEYLLYFYMDTDYKKFVNELADEVMKSEVVMAVQDNITTTSTVETTTQRTSATVSQYEVATHETGKRSYQVENVSTSVNVTYVKNWCMKSYQQNSYSDAVLEMGNEKEKIVNVPGKVQDSTSHSATSESVVDSGTKSYNEEKKDADGKVIGTESKEYQYTVYEQKLTDTHTISNTYEKGEYKTEGRESVFVKLYNKHKMRAKVRTSDYLFTILENNERTADLLDLTKYLIYKATNVPWGVLEFDYEGEFSLKSFASVSGLYGGTTQEKVWFALLDAGYSKEAAAGVLGNIEAECEFNASLIEAGNGIGFGLCQWSYGRRTQLEAYAQSKGKPASDVQIQIEFLLAEITPGGGANGFAAYELMNYRGSTPDMWRNASTPEEAAEHFCNTFERPGIPRMSVRTTAARKYYEELKDKEKSLGGGSGSIVEAAKNVHDYISSHNYDYSLNRSWEPRLPNNLSEVANVRGVCCATFVSWTLYEAGYDWMTEIGGGLNGCSSLLPFLIQHGATQIMNPTMDIMQPGDILFYGSGGGTHTDIFIGDGLWYNCGGDTVVDLVPPQQKGLSSTAYCIIRFN